MNEDSQLLHQIISRYETEEDEFLREIESMQQCVNTDTSDDMPEESPVLGTLCSLVGEIGQLRKENRKLRKRILENSTSSNENNSNGRSGIAFKMGSFLESTKNHTPSKPILSYRKNINSNEIRTGARERLCSPPKKDCLTTSSYSTDYSIDNTTRYPRSKVPPLVLPELSDSEEEEHSVFTEVTLPCDNGNNKNDTENDSSRDTHILRPRRSMMRRLHVISHHNSDHISPSSISASSSIEPPDTMSSSRASFLELIGIKRKNERNRMSMPIPSNFNLSSLINKKQRKRKISENEQFDASSGSSYEKIKSTINSKNIKNDVKEYNRKSIVKGNLAKSCKSLFEKHTKTQRFFDESEEETVYRNKKQRPKSVVYLENDKNGFSNSRIHLRTDSYKNILSSRDVSEESRHSLNDWQCLQNENTNLKAEVKTLKTFSSKVSNELKDKSKAYSNLEAKYISLEKEASKWKQKCTFNESLEKLTMTDRFNKSQLELLNSIQNKLVNYETEFRNIKNENMKSQQMLVNNSIRDQNAYQTCLKQVERLQKENFDLLQLHASGLELSSSSEYVKKILEMMPSYDALYSFAMRIVSKLTNLRKTLSEKCNTLNNCELEMLHLQTSLLLVHAQMERQKIILNSNKKENKTLKRKRSHSFDGISSITQAYNSDLNFYLPFKLHGNRIEQYKKAVKSSKEILYATNEQNIEGEFLRLFDCARCVSKPYDNCIDKKDPSNIIKSGIQNIIMYRNGKDIKISPQNSPKVYAKHTLLNAIGKSCKNVEIDSKNNEKDIDEKNITTANCILSNISSRRPISMIDMKEKKTLFNHKKTNSNEDELLNQSKPPIHNFMEYSSPISTPIQSKKIYSSTIITENQITGSKQVERKLVKQKSLQQPILRSSLSPILGKTIITKSYITEPTEYNALKLRLEGIGGNQKDYNNYQIPPKHNQQNLQKNSFQTTTNNNSNSRYHFQTSNTSSMIPTSPSIRRSHIITIKKPSKGNEKQLNNNSNITSQYSHLLSQMSSSKKLNQFTNSSSNGVSKKGSSPNNSVYYQPPVKDEYENLNGPTIGNVRNSIAKMNAMAKFHKQNENNNNLKTTNKNNLNEIPQQQNTESSTSIEKVVKKAGNSWLSRLRPITKRL
uniref:Centromere protein J n=1 Tax=Parastrongyloides trichosuri TaxID=131310 RepID=A0A0N4ZC35_PARTI